MQGAHIQSVHRRVADQEPEQRRTARQAERRFDDLDRDEQVVLVLAVIADDVQHVLPVLHQEGVADD